jgi:hypothetical protein
MASIQSLAVSILRLGRHTNVAAANRHHNPPPAADTKTASGCINETLPFLGCKPPEE